MTLALHTGNEAYAVFLDLSKALNAILHVRLSQKFSYQGSESRGQERANQSSKTKRMTNYYVSFTRANVFVI